MKVLWPIWPTELQSCQMGRYISGAPHEGSHLATNRCCSACISPNPHQKLVCVFTMQFDTSAGEVVTVTSARGCFTALLASRTIFSHGAWRGRRPALLLHGRFRFARKQLNSAVLHCAWCTASITALCFVWSRERFRRSPLALALSYRARVQRQAQAPRKGTMIAE